MGDEQVGRPIRAVVDSSGRVVVAWSGTDGVARRVRVARDDGPGDSIGVPTDVSLPGDEAVLTDLAAGPGGRLIAVWGNGTFDADQVKAAVSDGAGAPFGLPEAVSPAQEAHAGHAAFDPRTGVPTVVWTNRPGGSGGPVSGIRTYAQAAVRSG
jgi:hypothetical protein